MDRQSVADNVHGIGQYASPLGDRDRRNLCRRGENCGGRRRPIGPTMPAGRGFFLDRAGQHQGRTANESRSESQGCLLNSGAREPRILLFAFEQAARKLNLRSAPISQFVAYRDLGSTQSTGWERPKASSFTRRDRRSPCWRLGAGDLRSRSVAESGDHRYLHKSIRRWVARPDVGKGVASGRSTFTDFACEFRRDARPRPSHGSGRATRCPTAGWRGRMFEFGSKRDV